MLYINKIQSGDIIIPGYLDRFEDDNNIVQLTRESDAYTLIVLTSYFHIEDYPDIKSFVIIAHAGDVPDYDGFEFVHSKQICCADLDINETFYEYVNTEYIDNAKININCTNCKNCVNCRDCDGCNDCERCDNCVDCCDCDNCEDCRDCILCGSCFECNNCGNCSGCYNCSGCSECYNCKECNNCERCDDCDDCRNCITCKRCEYCNECSRCKNCRDYFNQYLMNN